MYNRGYYLVPRGIFKPEKNLSPLARSLFHWMLEKANYAGAGSLRRGQLLTTIAEMREVSSWRKGFAKQGPTYDQIRSAYGSLVKASLITTTKATHKLKITICNYDTMQNYKSYDSPNEHHNDSHTIEELQVTAGNKTNIMSDKSDEVAGFSMFWEKYPRKENKRSAESIYRKIRPPPPLDQIIKALEWQCASREWTRDGGKFIPLAKNYLLDGCWEDEPYVG